MTRWLADLDEQVFAAAEADMGTVGETLLRGVLGDAGWEGLPERGEADLHGQRPGDRRRGTRRPPRRQRGAARHDRPADTARRGRDSPPAFAEATELMAAAMPTARVEWVEGGHLINPAHPAVLGFVDEVLRQSVSDATR